MNDIFYLFGIAYIMEEICTSYKVLFPNKKEEQEFDNISDAMADELKGNGIDLLGIYEKSMMFLRFVGKKIFPMMVSILIIAWVIIGIIYSEESKLFSYVMAIEVITPFFPAILLLIIGIINKRPLSIIIGQAQQARKEKTFHPLLVFSSILKIVIIGYVTYSHFYGFV